MPEVRILIAEDDPNIRQGLADALESEGYTTCQAADGTTALECLAGQPVDLLLLDIMMPGKSGYDVCREARRRGMTLPIIMLTAKGAEIDKVVGLQLGADDYVTKPFGIHELLARVAAVLRRSAPAPSKSGDAPGGTFPFGAATVDPRRYETWRGSSAAGLSARELKLIEVFRAHPGEVLSRDALLNAVWGVSYYGTTRTLDQHIAQLRKKIELNPASPSAIQTVHGIGYRYRPAPDQGRS